MDGILLVDKPSGPTSFDVVRQTRKKSNQRKVGHAGTLDPLASGLLVVCLGQGTKLVPYLMAGDKRYKVRVKLGEETDTLDAEGEIVEVAPVPRVDESILRTELDRFVGTIEQLPPTYAAIKQDGEPLYRKARRGEKVSPKSRVVEIDDIEITDIESDAFELAVRCKKGTYIRSLARDVAYALGTVGHVTQLRRVSTSGFTVDDALCCVVGSAGRIDANLHPVTAVTAISIARDVHAPNVGAHAPSRADPELGIETPVMGGMNGKEIRGEPAAAYLWLSPLAVFGVVFRAVISPCFRALHPPWRPAIGTRQLPNALIVIEPLIE